MVTNLPSNAASVEHGAHRFLPTQRWLFLKVYGSATMTEKLLASGLLRELIARRMPASSDKSWFFVRYADPDDHLRIRIRDVDWSQVGPLLRDLSELQISHGIYRVAVDTYVRETWRYGGPEAIAAAEDFFCADSQFVRVVLGDQEAQASSDLGLVVITLGIAQLFSAFDLDYVGRLSVAKAACADYASELQPNEQVEIALGRRFRKDGVDITRAARGDALCLDRFVEAVTTAFTDRRQAAVALVRKLNENAPGADGDATRTRVLLSLVHMFCNRFFARHQRINEYVALDQVRRAYLGLCARGICDDK